MTLHRILLTYGELPVEVYEDFTSLGQAAAYRAAEILQSTIKNQGCANLVLATGNSMLSFLHALSQVSDIAWSQVNVFHMDEYVGMRPDHPASFRRFLREKIINRVNPAVFHEIQGDSHDLPQECLRYSELLHSYPTDLCCLGFGENGHLAFNDPPFADFDDPLWVKIVEMNERSRWQQVGEGHFQTLAEVPLKAITLTIPALLSARQILGIVPEKRKADAVRAALVDPISSNIPASILRTLNYARLFLDRDSASLLGNKPEFISSNEKTIAS
jgi:glucosamine-6-phosphate deaminase